jgi:hypothetical protein
MAWQGKAFLYNSFWLLFLIRFLLSFGLFLLMHEKEQAE